MRSWVLAFAIGPLTIAYSHAQQVTRIDFVAQPAILESQGDFTACGIRFVGITMTPKGTPDRYVDGSIMLTDKLYYLNKAAHFKADSKGDIGSVLPGRINWLKFGDAPVLKPSGGTLVPAENPNYMLFGSPGDKGMATLEAIYQPTTLWASFGDSAENKVVYSGTLRVDEATHTQLLQCTNSMVARLQAELRDEAK